MELAINMQKTKYMAVTKKKSTNTKISKIDNQE